MLQTVSRQKFKMKYMWRSWSCYLVWHFSVYTDKGNEFLKCGRK